MKALMWKHNGERLVYADLEYTAQGFKDKDNQIVLETNIADIVRDTRKNYVICGSCGELVKNTPQGLEEHWKEKAAQKNCLTCDNLSEDWRKKELKRTYKQDPDNPDKYISIYKYSVQLNCSYYGNINDESVVENNCKFLKCKTSTKHEISDFFTKYPHAFSTLITVDTLIDKKWVPSHSIGDAIMYHHPKMTTLVAVVSNKGIVCQFWLTQNGNEAFYSEKYDKLFFRRGGGHYTDRNVHNIPETRLISYTEKIKELFN